MRPLPAAIDHLRRADAPGRRPDVPAIALFFAVACLWSHFAAGWGEWRLPGGGDAPRIDGRLLIGFGPLLGALVAGTVRRGLADWPVGFRGRGGDRSLAVLAAPILFAALFGVDRFHLDPHVDAATIAASLAIACAAEEIGWREWLYNALAGLPLWGSALVTAALWLGWQLALEAAAGESVDPGAVAGLVVASFVLAGIARATRSSAVAAAWRLVAVAGFAGWQLVPVAIAVAGLSAFAARRPAIGP